MTTMLPKSQRLTKREFETVFKQGKRIRTKHLLVVVFETKEITGWGISVSKKKEKKAIERNRIKRFIYRAISNLPEELKNKAGLVMYQGKLPEKTKNLSDEIREALGKI